MSAKTARWKNAERQLADIFIKYNIDAERISRAGNYSESTHDINVKDMPELKPDSKYSQAGFKTSRLLEVIRDKYCKEKGEIPLLFCKGYRERSGKITMDAEFISMLLSFWLDKGTKEQLMKIYLKEDKE